MKNKKARSEWNGPVFSGGKLDGGLESFSCNELHSLRGLDLDLLAGLGIDTCAGFAMADFEGAETDELNALGFFNSGFDAVDYSGYRALGVSFARSEGFLDCCCEFDFVHLVVVLLWVEWSGCFRAQEHQKALGVSSGDKAFLRKFNSTRPMQTQGRLRERQEASQEWALEQGSPAPRLRGEPREPP